MSQGLPAATAAALERQAGALLQQGRVAEAISAYRRAVALPAGGWQGWFGLANACRLQGDAAAAIEAYQRCLELQPRCVEAAVNLGGVYLDQGELAAAEATFRAALAIRPELPDAYYNLGLIDQEKSQFQAAAENYQAALQHRPAFAEALNNLGNCLVKMDAHPAAVEVLNRAIKIRPNYPEAHFNLGNALRSAGCLDAALEAYRAALKGREDWPELQERLGYTHVLRGEIPEATAAFRQALQWRPDFLDAWINLGIVLMMQAELVAARQCYQRALDLQPALEGVLYNLSLLTLLSGSYVEGWRHYQWRFKGNRQIKLQAQPICTLWDGHDLPAGEPLLLVSEQGLGDTLQFCRYVLALRRRGVVVSLCAQQPLHRLLQASGLEAAPLTAEQAEAVAEGCWSPLLSLPGQLGVSPHNPIIQEPYLAPSAERREHWRRILAAERRPLLGLNWQGNPNTEVGSLQGRSLPLEALAPLAAAFGGSLLSLQKGPGSEQLASCSFRRQFVDCQEQLDAAWDFEETAAIIAACDLVITTDTAVAHLAGGMGHPTWLLLQQVPDWRWGLEGESTFWYPSLRLFRQRQRGDWAELIERVAAELGHRFRPAGEAGA